MPSGNRVLGDPIPEYTGTVKMRRLAAGLLVLALIVATTDEILYVSEIVAPTGSRGYPVPWRQVFVATFIALMLMAAALAVRASSDRWRPMLLGVSSIGLLSIGYVGQFSIGLPLLVAGLVVLVVLVATLVSGPRLAGLVQATAGGLLAAVIFFGGLELTAQAITCPAHGFEAGDGSSFFRGAFHYICLDGKLTLRPGPCNHVGATMDASGHVIAVSDC